MNIYTYLVLVFSILLFLICCPARADENTALHCVTSAAATTVLYVMVGGLFRVKKKKDKWAALGFAFGTTQAVGAAYEVGDAIDRGDGRLDMGDLGVNAVCGLGAAAGIALIEF